MDETGDPQSLRRLCDEFGRDRAMSTLRLMSVCLAVSMVVMPWRSEASGGAIAFSRGGVISIIDADGANLRGVAGQPAFRGSMPSWSPDARTLAVCIGDPGVAPYPNLEVYLVTLATGEAANLTNHPNDDVAPAWSPDGERIAFASTRDSQWPRENRPDIYTMRIDGSDVRRLTTYDGRDMTPAWSPDGQHIAFATGRDSPDPFFVDNIEIYIMDADGGNKRRVTQTPHFHDDFEPAWSPDGSQIAFSAGTDILGRDIYVTNVDGANRRRLTTHFANDTAPDWSPDGTQIAFQSTRDGPDDDGPAGIFVIDADGTNIRRLTRSAGGDYWPDWFDPAFATPVSPLGKRAVLWGWLKGAEALSTR
jgi:Tol biopolymer transport system component